MTQLETKWTEPIEMIDDDPMSARRFNNTVQQNQMFLMERANDYVSGIDVSTDFVVTSTTLVTPTQDDYKLELDLVTGHVLIMGHFQYLAQGNMVTYVAVKVDDSYFVGAVGSFDKTEFWLHQYYNREATVHYTASFAVPCFVGEGLHTFEPAFKVNTLSSTINLSARASMFTVREL